MKERVLGKAREDDLMVASNNENTFHLLMV
jgi:hypothetical protein